MSDNTERASGGIGFFGLLTIVFITLKLCHVIDWSWWWVLAPVWVPVAVCLVILGGALLAVGAIFVGVKVGILK